MSYDERYIFYKSEVRNMIKEFKEFISRGNVMDLAVGVIIGGAFGKIIASLVDDILMPIIGILLGGVNFTELKYVITPAVGDTAESAILYGQFIQSLVDFLIIAFSIFMIIKAINKVKKPKPVEEPVSEEPSKEEVLLTEIRDLLKEK